MDAVLALMAIYYVFDLSYSKEVLPTLLFLQSYCLKLEDDATNSCESLAIFTKMLEKEERLAAAKRSMLLSSNGVSPDEESD